MYTNTHRHRVNCIESSSALILIYTIMLEQLQHQLEVPFKPLLPQRAAKSALTMPAVKRKQGCLICQLILQNIFCFVIHSLIILTKKTHHVLQYIARNMHTVFALLCFVVVIHWLIFPYPSGLLHWHCGNLTIAPVPAKQPWWIWINTSFEFIMNDYITTTKQSTTKPCAYFLGYTVLEDLAVLNHEC